jgi:hypothetical protein
MDYQLGVERPFLAGAPPEQHRDGFGLLIIVDAA